MGIFKKIGGKTVPLKVYKKIRVQFYLSRKYHGFAVAGSYLKNICHTERPIEISPRMIE